MSHPHEPDHWLPWFIAVCEACLLAVIVAFLVVNNRPARRPTEMDAVLARLEAIDREDAELRDRLQASEERIAELTRISHERRALLANELRREIAAVARKIVPPVAVEVTRGDLEAVATADAIRTESVRATVDELADLVKAIEAKPPVVERVIERVAVPVFPVIPRYAPPWCR